MEERRQKPRVGSAGITAKVYRAGRDVGQELIDVSCTGMRVALIESVDPGDAVLVHLIHDATGRIVYVAGEVRWVRRVRTNSTYQAGLQFLCAREPGPLGAMGLA